MEKVSVYKEKTGRSMLVNDSDEARAALEADGWTFDKPKGFKEVETPTVETMESLQADNAELTKKVEDLNQQVEDLTAPPKKGKSD